MLFFLSCVMNCAEHFFAVISWRHPSRTHLSNAVQLVYISWQWLQSLHKQHRLRLLFNPLWQQLISRVYYGLTTVPPRWTCPLCLRSFHSWRGRSVSLNWHAQGSVFCSGEYSNQTHSRTWHLNMYFFVKNIQRLTSFRFGSVAVAMHTFNSVEGLVSKDVPSVWDFWLLAPNVQ